MAIDRLSAGDELMLRASAAWPQHIVALGILDGAGLYDEDGLFRIEAIRAMVGARLGRAPRLCQVLVEPRRGLGPPFWADVPAVDLRHHVRERPIGGSGSELDLLTAVEDLRRLPLDASLPLWAIWLLTGLPDRRVGLFVCLHHAIADGLAAMALLGVFLDAADGADGADGAPPVPTVDAAGVPPPRPLPSSLTLLVDNVVRVANGLMTGGVRLLRPRRLLRDVRAAWPALRELLAERPATETTLNRFVGPHRSLALVQTTVDEVGRIARDHGASPNDVLLALTAGGIRASLVARGEPVDGVTIRVYVPVSLRRGRSRREGPDRGNRVAQMAVPVRLNEADPRRRLRRITRETARRKRRPRPSLGTWFRGGLETRLLLRAVSRQRVNTTTAYLRGPKKPLAFASAPLVELYPILPLIGNVTLGVGVVTYAGTFGIAAAGDRTTYPDLDAFVEGVRADLAAFGAADVRVAEAAPMSSGRPRRLTLEGGRV
jgi:WS/DGAT/MGAT family acyltransferase